MRSAFLLAVLCAIAAAQTQQVAGIGDLRLESGETIRNCRLGYRTYGKLNADHSNAILWPTWFTGRTEQLAEFAGPGKLLDPARYYVIFVDALGNGVSSAPSNSASQPRMRFPKFTIRDMVASQHRLLTEKLGIRHVRAVMGISMGGMQTFQWMVSYPDFMDKAIPIAGSPRMAPYDLLHWQLEIDAIMSDPGWKEGEYTENPAKVVLGEVAQLLLSTPQGYNRTHTRQQVFESIEKFKTDPTMDANNHIRTAQAVMKLDVSDAFGGSMEKAASVVRAQVLIVAATQDHMVNPKPALEFAKLVHAQTLELTSDCGHLANGCESAKMLPVIQHFLEN